MTNYNEFAEKYAKGSADLERKMKSHFYSLITEPLAGKQLLDIGCGSGQDAAVYAEKGAKVYGLDVSEKQIALAKDRECGNFAVGSMNELPYEANTFDIITSYYALQASDQVPGALEEMVRVTKPNGILLILAKHPVTQLLESYINDQNGDYFAKRNVTSYIFNRSIKLSQPGHTLMEYFHARLLKNTSIELFEEHMDFPASEQVIADVIYPTCMIIKYRKI
ncbi:MAG: class I SAM-dependent methyltransferase [Phormidesmis sp.]